MIYREFGKTGKQLSVLGFGGLRFPYDLYMTEAGREKCTELVVEAWKNGVNYFDTAPDYCESKSEQIYGAAFRCMKDFYVSTKSTINEDPKADDVRRRIEKSLDIMGLEKIHFYHMWCILDIEQYRRIIAPGGPYWGALKAKEEGLIEHICFSAHCTGNEIAEIIKEGYFEGVTLGYNVINSKFREEGVRAAREQGIGVITMNPLAGGFIPKNKDKFSFICENERQSVCEAALRYNAAIPGINVVLSGMCNKEELYSNIKAMEKPLSYNEDFRRRIAEQLDVMYDRLCTGCGYCNKCPQKIRVPQLMSSYNQFMLNHNNGESLLDDLENVQHLDPEEKVPCIKCGKCEKKCTQHLNIVKRIEEINRVIQENYTEKLNKYIDKLKYIFETNHKIAFYGIGKHAHKLFNDFETYFPDDDVVAQVFLFDKNPEKQGKSICHRIDAIVSVPYQLEKLGLDVLVISSSLYFNEIYEELQYLESYGVTIIKA